MYIEIKVVELDEGDQSGYFWVNIVSNAINRL